jgi:GxxExxY protein
MVKCSNCKQEGHNKAKCSNQPPIQVAAPDTSVLIRLSAEVNEKLAKLTDLCVQVASGLGKGYVEGVYQQALGVELQEAGIRYMSEEPMPITYKGLPLGGGHSIRLDVMLLNYLPFIYELKAVSKICPEHHWQVVRYMTYKDVSYGAVVNFSQSDRGSLEIQFVVKHNGTHWLYDPVTERGTPLIDFSMSLAGVRESSSGSASVYSETSETSEWSSDD